MKIQIFNQAVDGLSGHVDQAIQHIISQIESDVLVEEIQYDMDLVLKFKVEGRDEFQVVTTDREIFGMREMYTIRPIYDANGVMLIDEILDNKEETFEKAAQSLEQELPRVAIESEFDPWDIGEVKHEFSSPDGEIKEVMHELHDGSMLLQYYRKDIGLVHEVHLSPKGEEYTGPIQGDGVTVIDTNYTEVTEVTEDVIGEMADTQEEEVIEVVEYPSCGFTKCTDCE